VFLSASGEVDLPAFLRWLGPQRHAPGQALIVGLRTEEVPHVPLAERATLLACAEGLSFVQLRFGYNDEPDVPQALGACHALGFDERASRYFLAPDRFDRIAQAPMARWRKRLFSWLARASAPAAEYFHLPAGRTTQLQWAFGRAEAGTAQR
jgi:KUP system potassium uptake protein